MKERKAKANWIGTIREGSGTLKTETGSVDSAYSFSKRFENETGTNPEELIAAAHAGCFTMAFSGNLERAGFKPENVETEDTVHLERQDNGFTITKIHIYSRARVPGIDEKTFQEVAEKTKQTCPVSRALAGVEMTMQAELVS